MINYLSITFQPTEWQSFILCKLTDNTGCVFFFFYNNPSFKLHVSQEKTVYCLTRCHTHFYYLTKNISNLSKKSPWNEFIAAKENIQNAYGVNVVISTYFFKIFQTFIPAKNNGLEDVLHGISVALSFAPTMQCTFLKTKWKIT